MEELLDGLTFSDLPYHIKCCILRYLTEQERKQLRLVSNEWNYNCIMVEKMIRQTKAEEVCVTNTNYHYILKNLSSYISCKRIDFYSFTRELPEQVVFPEHISSIGFKGQITNHDLISILLFCPHLNKLEFTEVDYTDKSLSAPADHVQLPNLQTIFIRSKSMEIFQVTLRKDEAKLLDFLCGLTYGALKSFGLLCSNTIIENLQIHSLFNENAISFPVIVRFIEKHKATLARVVLGLSKMPLIFTLLPFMNDNGKPLQLESITGLCCISSSFDMMFRVQHHLQSLTMNDALKNWDFISVAISQSAYTITTINLTGDGKDRIYDFTVLSVCMQLKILTLIFNNCLMYPFPKLPSTIRKLHLSGPLTENDLLCIASNQINLEDFILEDNLSNRLLVHKNVASIHFELFMKLIRMKKIKYVCFIRCLLDWKAITKWCSEHWDIKMKLIPKDDNSGMHHGLQIEKFYPIM